MRHGDCKQRDGLLVRVIRKDRAHQLLSNFYNDRCGRNGGIECDRASDRVEDMGFSLVVVARSEFEDTLRRVGDQWSMW